MYGKNIEAYISMVDVVRYSGVGRRKTKTPTKLSCEAHREQARARACDRNGSATENSRRARERDKKKVVSAVVASGGRRPALPCSPTPARLPNLGHEAIQPTRESALSLPLSVLPRHRMRDHSAAPRGTRTKARPRADQHRLRQPRRRRHRPAPRRPGQRCLHPNNFPRLPLHHFHFQRKPQAKPLPSAPFPPPHNRFQTASRVYDC